MDVNEILGESVHFFSQNFWLVAGIVVLAGLPLFIWQALSLAKPNEWVAPLHFRSARDLADILDLVKGIAEGKWNGRLLASLCVSAYTGLVQAGALAYALSERIAERAVTPLQAVAAAFHRLGALAAGNGVTLMVVAAVALLAGRLPTGSFSLIAFAVLMLALYPRWLLTTQTIMADGLNGIAGLRRSIELVGGRYWFVLGVWLVAELLLVITSLIPTFILGIISVSNLPSQTRQLANLIIPSAAAIVFDPFWHVTLVLVYFQLRRRWLRLNVRA